MKKGKDLSESFIKFWNKTMKEAFKEDKPLRPKNRKKFCDDVFFHINANGKIASTGRLIPIDIELNKKKYSILGVGDVVSIIRKKGYGKKLLRKMRVYAKSKNKTIIGFCQTKNTGFYKKCGFTLDKKLLKRFRYRNKTNKEENCVFYSEEKDKVVTNMLKNPRLNAKTKRAFW
ncbi:GNAT family N-acetyltransferase [Candidatus Woesearchaeota archaeon]|nr:GNAT family N-acetyltransferase [Candidatus Woesearchaeota archaeon]